MIVTVAQETNHTDTTATRPETRAFAPNRPTLRSGKCQRF